jgi:hypothetical protein
MGKGKAPSKAGGGDPSGERVFEVDGVMEAIARNCLRLAALEAADQDQVHLAASAQRLSGEKFMKISEVKDMTVELAAKSRPAPVNVQPAPAAGERNAENPRACGCCAISRA